MVMVQAFPNGEGEFVRYVVKPYVHHQTELDRLIIQASQLQYQVSMASHCSTVEQKLSLLLRNFSTLTSYHNLAF